MAPPTDALQDHECSFTEPTKNSWPEPTGYGQISVWVMCGINALQDFVRPVHCEDADQENDLKDQDQVAVKFRPAFHLGLVKAWDEQDVPTDQKNNGRNERQDGQHFDGTNHEVIKAPKTAGKKAMHSEYAVDEDLNQFDLGKYEGHV